jgi:hypothetical protein
MPVTMCNLTQDDIDSIKILLNNSHVKIVTHAIYDNVQIITDLNTSKIKFYRYDPASKELDEIDPPKPNPLPKGLLWD